MPRTGLVPELTRPAWIVLGGDALSAVGSGLTLPFFIVYLTRVRGLDLGVAGLALSTLALAGLVGNPASGALTDRFGPRRTLILGLFASAAGTGWLAFVAQTWAAFGAAALIGLGNSTIWPAQDALLATTVPPERRSSVFSVRHATLNAGFGLGALAAAAIADFSSVGSFQALYLLDALSFLAFIPLLVGLRGVGERVPPEEDDVRAPYGAVLRDPAFVRIWALAALLVVVGYAQYQAAFAPFATRTGGLGSHALSVAFAVNTLVVAAIQLPVLRLMVGRRRTSGVALAFACWAASWTATVLAARLGGGALAVAAFAGAMAIFALGETLLSPTLSPMVNDLAPDRLRGRYNGLYTLAWTTGFIVGPALAGTGLGVGDGTPFMIMLVAGCCLGVIAALRLRRYVATVDLVGPAHGEEPVLVPA